MAALTYFTVTGTFLAVGSTPTPMTGRITFTPLVNSGDVITADTLTPPASLMLEAVSASVRADGRVRTGNALGVQLVANTGVLELEGDLYYRVDFREGLKAGVKSFTPASFTFKAPTTSTTIDLTTVAPIAGSSASQISKGPKGDPVDDFVIDGDGNLQFFVDSQPIGEPQALPGASWGTIANKPPVVAAGATQAEARTAIGAVDTTALAGKYTKPAPGIPTTDLATAVQTSLGKAESAVQPATLSYVRPARKIAATNGTNDNAAIQSILNEGANEIVFPAGGTWTVDSTMGTGGLSPQSNTRIIIEEGAVLRVKPNNSDYGRLIDVGRNGAVQNVTIEGAGTLLGDVLTHTGTTGEYGHLINIWNGSSNIRVIGPMLLKQAWGDAIYIGGTSTCHDVLVDGVTVEDCRREGIAPFWVDGCTIRNCHIFNIGLSDVTSPGSGIDCEPNSGWLVNHLTLENNRIENTAGCGIYVSANPGPVSNLIIRDNEITDCGLSAETITTYQWNGIHVSNVARPVLTDNVVRGSGYDGDPNGLSGHIFLRSCVRPIVDGGYLVSGLGNGLQITGSTAPQVTDVTIYNNYNHGIFVGSSDGAILRRNQVLDNVQSNLSTKEHIAIQGCNNTITDENLLRGNKGPAWIKIETSGNDNAVVNNIGVGPTPTATLADEGVRTSKRNNRRTDTSVSTFWTSDDSAAVKPNKSGSSLIGQTYDLATQLTGTLLPAVATLYFCKIPLTTPETITNVIVNMTVLGDTLTNAFVGLYKSDGTFLRQSADQSTAWGTGGTTGMKIIPLSSPVAVVPSSPDDFVWAVIYVGAATTKPTFGRGVTGQSLALNVGASASQLRFSTTVLASTATLTSVTPTSMAAASNSWWVGLS